MDDRHLIVSTSAGQISRWSLPDGKLIGQPVDLKTTIQPMEISADGRFFATGSTDGIVRLWSAESGELIRTHGQGAEINSVAFSPDGKLVAGAGENRIVHLWNIATGELQTDLVGHTNEVLRVVFAPDSRRLVTASLDYTARIWNTEGHQLHVLQHQGEVVDAVFDPTGNLVATGSRDRTALIWDSQTGQPKVRSLLHDQAVRSVRFSPDGQRLLTLDFFGPRLWDVATGHPLTVHLQMPDQIITGIGFQSTSTGPQFTPDGRSFFIAVAATEGRLWESQPPPSTIPNWFPDFLEGIAGQQFNGDEEIPAAVSNDAFLDLRTRLLSASDQDFYTLWARTWLEGN
jgi:WD40 repeat protein